MTLRGLLDQFTRSEAACLLIGSEQQRDGAPQLQARSRDGLSGADASGDARLPVPTGGSVQPAVLPLQRHVRERSHGPDGVVMAEQQRALTVTAVKAGFQVVAGAVPGMPADLPARAAQEPIEQLSQRGERRQVAGRWLRADELLKYVRKCLFVGVDVQCHAGMLLQSVFSAAAAAPATAARQAAARSVLGWSGRTSNRNGGWSTPHPG